MFPTDIRFFVRRALIPSSSMRTDIKSDGGYLNNRVSVEELSADSCLAEI